MSARRKSVPSLQRQFPKLAVTPLGILNICALSPKRVRRDRTAYAGDYLKGNEADASSERLSPLIDKLNLILAA